MDDLDKLYSPSYWSKRFNSVEEVIENHLKFIENASNKTVKKIQCELNIPYGNTQRQKIDIFGTDLSEDAPIVIFVHGGYWQASEITRSSYHFIAENLHKHGIKTIFLGYDLCPQVTIPQIVKQVENASKKCLEYATKNKSKGVHFMGHSAGAHLVASLFTGFVKSLSEDEQRVMKGIFLISGVFDLTVMQKTVINEPLKLDERVAVEMSPLKQKFDGAKSAVFLFVGEHESPEFIRQSEEFSESLEKSGCAVEFAVVARVDHFDIIEKLHEQDFEVTKCLIKIVTNK